METTPTQELIRMSEIIKIEKYSVEIDQTNPARTIMFAIAGKKKFRIPDAFREMCNDSHLAIQEQTLERPELFDEHGAFFIPRRTSA